MTKGSSFLIHLSGLTLGLALTFQPGLQAQETGVAEAAPALTSQDALPAQKRPIELPDILDWRRINATTLSPDGAWFAYRLTPTEGNSEAVIRSVATDTEHRFPVGAVAGGGFGGGSSVVFSDDSGWLAFTTYPTEEETKQARQQRRPARNKVGLVELTSGEMTEIEDIQAFAFAGERGGWIALHRYSPAQGSGAPGGGAGPGSASREGEEGDTSDDRPRGSDLILRELSTGVELNLGNVAEFAFDDSGRWLAWIVDAEGQAGNGVQLRDMESGVVQVLESDEAWYSRLGWAEDDPALAVLKGVESEDHEDRLYTVLGWTGFGSRGGPTKVLYDPEEDESFPDGMTVSPNRSPEWSDALDAIFFGIHEAELKEEEGEEEEAEEEAGVEEEEGEEPRPSHPESEELEDDEKPDLVIWHWKDPRLQAMQQVQEGRDRDFSYLAVYWPGQGRFVRLADERVENVTRASKGPWAVGYDNDAYELWGNLDGRRFQDVYAIDTRTGDRQPMLERSRWSYDISPDGSHFLYYRDGHFHTYEFATGEHRNISASVPTSFINTESDVNVVDPPIFPRGWTEDGRFVVLNDNWDLWRVEVHGDEGLNLTVNGKDDGIRYRSAFQFDPDDELGFDLADPLYVNPYGEWTKKGGIGRINRGRPGVELLLWDDATFGPPMKAENADVYLFTRATFEEYPNYHAVDGSFRNPTQITDGYPEQSEFLWSSGSVLLNYESDKGDQLQAALHLPADYEEGKSYPTIVYIYERLSQGLNSYTFPSANGFNKSVYTSNGYAVLMPDIAYRVNDPGMSAVWCVLPALQAATETGVVDPERVGIHGHSWGGYQTAFLVTQTDAFAAAVAGAPLTNMISMYASIYWNSGSADGAIFESSQGRFEGGPWDHLEAYARNSPVYFAENITTPVLMLHNDEDGAVDWNQGIEYYNTLRRLQKPVVMLQYVGENHGLARQPNRKDYTVRQREFWDHFLKGTEAPDWWKEGVPHLDLADHLEERALEIKKQVEARKASKQEKKGGGAPGS